MPQVEETEQESPPEPVRSEKWVRGALKRGFYSAVQAFHAANLSLIMLAPRTARAFGLEKLTGGADRLREKITSWEQKIDKHDLEPVKSHHLKSGASFLLFNATYLAPVIAIGLAAGLAGGTWAAILTAGIVNTHATMGEAFVKTARRRSQNGIDQKEKLDALMKDKNFRRPAKVNVAIMGAVCLGITLAAGPLSRMMGGFTTGALKSLSRTPLGGLLTDKFVSSAQKGAIKATRKPLGRVFSKVVNNGPTIIAAKTTAFIATTRAATSALMARFNKSAEQDNNPAQAVANDNDKTVTPAEPQEQNGTGQQPPIP